MDKVTLLLGRRQVSWEVSHEQATLLAQYFVQILGPAKEED